MQFSGSQCSSVSKSKDWRIHGTVPETKFIVFGKVHDGLFPLRSLPDVSIIGPTPPLRAVGTRFSVLRKYESVYFVEGLNLSLHE